jgi:hypothetical protein
MATASPRLRALLAGGAALLALGVIAPVHATPGNGNGTATGRPDDGTAGKADDKAPGGQGSDDEPNRGYECDKNHGVGQGNPAHTGCGAEDDGDPEEPAYSG